MSQAGILNVAGGGGGGSPIQTLTGDTGGPVPPTANNINIIGGSSIANNANGITVAGNAGTSTEVITLTNRIPGSGTTTDAVTPVTLFTFPLGAVPGVYNFTFQVVAFNTTLSLGSSYDVNFGVRTTGVIAADFGAFDHQDDEEGVMANAGITFVTNVPGNTIRLDATGLAGSVIHWNTLGEYIFVS